MRAPDVEARRAIRLGAIAVLTVLAGGAAALPTISRYRLWFGSQLYRQFSAIEPWWLLCSAATALAVLFMTTRATPDREAIDALETSSSMRRIPPLAIAAAVFVLTLVGTYVIFHAYYFADDEYSAWVQAVIFAHGKSSAVVPEQWCRWIAALTPTSVATSGCSWSLSFLPIHSLIRAAFIAAGIDHVAGPAIAATSILLLAAIARRLWPNRPDRVLIAVLVLAASTQFLVMSMTMWSMPTHLLFALIWLWLFVENSRWSIALLPWVGVAALGVHSPLPHGFWVVGFLIRYPWERRWLTTLYIAAVYVLGLMFWLHWLNHAPSAVTTLTTSGLTASLSPAGKTLHTVVSIFQTPSLLYRLTMLMHLSLLQTWNTPLAMLCGVAAVVAWKQLHGEMRYVALSFLFMLIARTLYTENQGEGWGYRYAYDGLANLALLTAVGVDVLKQAVGSRAATRLFAASLIFSAIELPLRGIQVERIVRPYWETSKMLSQSRGEVVVYPWHLVMWGRQTLRNDPFLRNKPKIMGLYELWPNKLDSLFRAYPGRVTVIGRDDLERIGVPMEPSIDSLRALVQ